MEKTLYFYEFVNTSGGYRFEEVKVKGDKGPMMIAMHPY
jgi:hypothetical protein